MDDLPTSNPERQLTQAMMIRVETSNWCALSVYQVRRHCYQDFKALTALIRCPFACILLAMRTQINLLEDAHCMIGKHACEVPPKHQRAHDLQTTPIPEKVT